MKVAACHVIALTRLQAGRGFRSVCLVTGGTTMDEDRLIEIESRLAHQEHLLTQLNDALTDQQAQLMQVIELCQTLIERMRSMAEQESPGDPLDERPPHY